MIDIHCHILPKMDDGAKNLEETRALMEMQQEQGVKIIVATPHFYATGDSPESFLKRRTKCFEEMKHLSSQLEIPVLLGAEVQYFTGISNIDMTPFLIQGTDILLLEMPFMQWNSQIIDEVFELADKYQVVLAHIERYIPFKQPKTIWDDFHKAGILFQINTDSLLNKKQLKHVLKFMKENQITFVASDCHNTRVRTPKFTEALSVMRKKLPEDALQYVSSAGARAFKQAMKRAETRF